MKMFNKSECEYKGGYIVCDGEIVSIDNEIVDLLNQLDIDLQRSEYESNRLVQLVDTDDQFYPVSEHGKIKPVIKANTPELDKMAEHSIKLMEEYDAQADAAKANLYFDGIYPLLIFVNDDFIVSAEHSNQHRFDLPVVGNPLELDKDKLADLVMSMFA